MVLSYQIRGRFARQLAQEVACKYCEELEGIVAGIFMLTLHTHPAMRE